MSTPQQPGGPSAPALTTDAPPSYDASEQTKNPDGPPTVQPTAQPQMPYATNVPYAGGFPMVQGQGLPQYQMQPPVQYVVAAPYPTMAAVPKPNYPGPHDFMAYALIVAVISGFLNLLSLALTIPAIVCAAVSMHKKSQGQYPAASKLATAAFVLTTINVVFVLLGWLAIVGGLVGSTGDRRSCEYISYSRYSGYYCRRSYYYY